MSTTIVQLTADLEAVQTEFRRTIEAASGDALLQAPAPGGWTAAQAIGHVIEMQPFWIGKAASLSTPTPRPLNRTVEEIDARKRAVDIASRRTREQLLVGFDRSCASALEQLRGMTDAGLLATGPGWDGSITTAEAVIREHVIDHVAEHAAQVQMLSTAAAPR